MIMHASIRTIQTMMTNKIVVVHDLEVGTQTIANEMKRNPTKLISNNKPI